MVVDCLTYEHLIFRWKTFNLLGLSLSNKISTKQQYINRVKCIERNPKCLFMEISITIGKRSAHVCCVCTCIQWRLDT